MAQYRDFSDAELSAPDFDVEHPSPSVKEYDIDFTRLLYMQHNEVDLSIRHADQKAQLILGVNTVFIAALASGLAPGNTAVLLEAVVLGLLIFSVFFALRTVMPRFRREGFRANLFFFGDIMEMTQEDYVKAYMNLNLQDVKVAIMQQIHVKSSIVHRKYTNVQRSLTFLILALFAWAIAWGVSNLLLGG
jgi:hypothetical protein